MLKFVLIGIFIIGAFGFVLWNLWNMILIKNKHFANSENAFSFISDFKDVAKKLKMIRFAKIKNWMLAILTTILTVILILTYFFVTRNAFANNHAHSYKSSVIKEATCIEQGTLEYKCRYCSEKYEEPISVIEHEYIEKREKEPTCTTEGILVKECKNCSAVTKENIPTNDEHKLKIASFSQASFLKNGYTRYACENCGAEEYSLRVQNFNWIILVAIIVLVVALIIIVAIRVEEVFWKYTFEHPMFWISLILAVLSVILMIFHWGVILPHQENNKPVYQSVSGAPVDCELTEVERTESSYTENGTVVYKCQKCQKEYTEYLELKQIDIDNIPLYNEPTIAEGKEKENNNKIDKATEIPLQTKVTGNLYSTNDVDFYKITLLADGDVKFNFTHEADDYSNHWYATIYDTDKKTVLSEGYIEKGKNEFAHSGLPAGTYYLKISAISGGNPLLNIFSKEKYHLIFAPVCTEHTNKSQYFMETPSCLKETEIKTVCNICNTVVLTETKKIDHSWSEWEIVKPSTIFSFGEKVRVCTLCNQSENGKIFTYWWVIPLLIAEILLLIICSVVLLNGARRQMPYILLLLIISILASIAVLKVPLFNKVIWDGVVLGAVYLLNLTPFLLFICHMVDDIVRRANTFKTVFFTLAIIFAVMMALGFTVFLSRYAITVAMTLGALTISGLVTSVIAYKDDEDTWMAANSCFTAVSAVFTIFFALRI